MAERASRRAFALHPLHVESVAWASERKDTLSTFFGLLSLIAYCALCRSTRDQPVIWVAVTLALGLLAKPMLVTWPLVMLLLDYWPSGQISEIRSQSQRSAVRLPAGALAKAGGLVVEKSRYLLWWRRQPL